MPFPKFEIAKYPPRQWAGFGFPGTGKSGFSVMMRGPLLVVDSDQRFSQTMRECQDRAIQIEAHRLSTNSQDNVQPSKIALLLDANMPGSKIGTISVDSLTTIITPKVVKAIVDKDEGRESNLAAGFKAKAMAMRQLQDAVTKWGTDCFWIWHLNESRGGTGDGTSVNETLSKTERIRIGRSLNLRLQFSADKGRFGVKVVWARYGRSGMTLWDEAHNYWRGMPERIEAAVYDGLSDAERAALEKEPPELFPDEETAIGWGYERGPFHAVEHARNAWDKLKRESGFADLKDLTPLWIADVERRIEEEAEKAGDGNGHSNGKATNGKPANASIAVKVSRPADFNGVRALLAQWEQDHADDRVLADTPDPADPAGPRGKKSLTNYRGLVLGTMDRYVGGEEARHILVDALDGTPGGSGKTLSQARLSAYWQWMALHAEDAPGKDGKPGRHYLSTPETDWFVKEANAIIAAYRLAHGQSEMPL